MPKRLLRFAPLAVLVLAAGLAYASGLAHSLTLDGVAAHRAAWTQAAAERPVQSLALFIAAYAIIAGAGVPLAFVLTLASGVIFGGLAGGLASATGATLAAVIGYAATRSALAPWLRRRAKADPRLAALVDGFHRSGFPLILSARFMPVMPFAVVNVAAGLAAAPLRAYVAATLIAALPTSYIYASLGAGLGSSLDAHSLAAAVRSPRILLPLVAVSVLSLLPLAVHILRERRSGGRKD